MFPLFVEDISGFAKESPDGRGRGRGGFRNFSYTAPGLTEVMCRIGKAVFIKRYLFLLSNGVSCYVLCFRSLRWLSRRWSRTWWSRRWSWRIQESTIDFSSVRVGFTFSFSLQNGYWVSHPGFQYVVFLSLIGHCFLT